MQRGQSAAPRLRGDAQPHVSSVPRCLPRCLDSTRLGSTRLDLTRLDSTRLDSTRPDPTRLDPTRPELTN